MSDDPRRHPEHRGDPDHLSVDDFFARERAEAPVLDGDESRWRGIVGAAGHRRTPWARYLLVAAAVAVLAGALGWGLLRTGPGLGPAGPTTSSVSPNTPATSASATPTPRPSRPSATGGASPSSTPAGPVVAVPVPASFRVRSVTTADSRHLFALGAIACPGGTCPALAASTDDGASWHLVHTFPTGTTPAGNAPGQPGGAASLSDVRFANASVGWVFGGAVMRTTDGGRTWQDYPHPGGDVLDLETDGTEVVLTAAPACAAGTCHGAISIVRASVSAGSAKDVVGTVAGGAAVNGAPISWHAGRAYVSPVVTPSPGAAPPGPVVVQPGGLQAAGPRGCGNGLGSQLVAPASGSRLFAVCPASGAAGQVGYDVQASTDGGATWQPVSSARLVLVNAGRTAFAAADGSSILAVSGGSDAVHGSMVVSTDGGVTWAPPASPPPLPQQGWAWVGAPGGSLYYALSADSPGSYWRSADRGQSWQPVRVAGS